MCVVFVQDGVHQAYHLGEFLHQRYTKELNTGLIFTNYSRTQIHVRSTDVDRTIMTAQCLLAALFKPGADQVTLQHVLRKQFHSQTLVPTCDVSSKPVTPRTTQDLG